MRIKNKLRLLFVYLLFFEACTNSESDQKVTNDNGILGNKSNWAPNTLTKIKETINANKNNSKSYVVLDFDNTCLYPDIQENLFIYQMENLIFKMSPEEFYYAFTHCADNGNYENIMVSQDNFQNPYTNLKGEPINI